MTSDRSLDIVAVGLGQAGGNLAAEFARRGYRGLALNTARTDLSSLGDGSHTLPDSQRMYIGLEGYDGAGSDVEYGRECIRRHAGPIRDAVRAHAEGADAVVVTAGLGGGTGSSVAELVKLLTELEVPTVVLTTLPHGHESGIAKVNALYGVRDLAETPVDGWVLIDNARLAQLHHGVPMDEYFETINSEIVEPLDLFNRLNDRDSIRAIRTLDGEDFRTLLLTGGVLNYHMQELAELSSEGAVAAVRGALAANPMMPEGFQLSDVSYLGLVIEASERALHESPFSLYEEIAQELKHETGGAAVYLGLYRRPGADGPAAALRLLSSSNALPVSIGAMLSDAEREASSIHDKVQKSVAGLDLGRLEKLHLSRRPQRPSAHAARPIPSPQPAREEAAGSGAQADEEPASSGPGPAARPEPREPRSQVAALRRLVAVGRATESQPEPDPEPALGTDADPAAAQADEASVFRARFERLAQAFREAGHDDKRIYIARELIASQRSGEALERLHAVGAMVRLNSDMFRDALREAAEDSDPHVAVLAKRALKGS